LALVEKVIKSFKILLDRINNFFKSRTIDSEHIIGIIYALLYLLPFLVNSLIYAIITLIFSYLPLTTLIVSLLMCIINCALLIYFVQTFIKFIREKRFLLGTILLYLILAFLLGTIFWFGMIFLSLTLTMTMFLPDSIQPNEFLAMIYKYSNNYQRMSALFESSSKLGAPIIQILAISNLLNSFIPEKYKTIDLKFFDKIIRILFKIIFIIIPLLAFFIFYHIDKTSFTIIGLITVIITWIIDPKNIAILINLKVKVSDEDIKPEILNKFKLFQLFISFIVVSWAISVYFFQEQSIEIRLYISLGSLLCFMFVLLICQRILKRNGESWLNNNFKDEIAKKFIEDNFNSDDDDN
jgi:brp/blh family beta-carotene 15,15'-monooxygenase